MQRKQFLSALLTGSLLGRFGAATAADTSNWIMDDGVMELMPEYTIQHIQGQPHSDVYAAFTSVLHKKLVRLRAGDSITVNGQLFQGLDHTRGYYYKARIPVTEGTFTLTLTRASNPTMTHNFELPILGILELPKVYQPYEPLRVPVKYIEPPNYIRDSYSCPIYGPALRFDLASTTRKKDNRYQFDRLPDIQDGAIVFRHIIERAPQPGFYPAEIFRQHHVALNELSNASRTGWATLSNTQPFTIEVK